MFGLLALEELVAARYQMALSLGFHIVLSCFGVAFPTMIYVVHRRGLYRGDEVALTLARKWSKVAAVLFAVGAVSGTILSFEMGLLWPGMMATFGDVIGLPFALEGIAFFVEAMFIGIYLFGWDRLPPKVHLRTLIPIIVSGLFGTFCILAVNSWMNAPSGFRLARDASGTCGSTDVDPLAAIFNGALWPQFVHMFVATYLVTGFVACRCVRRRDAARPAGPRPPSRLHRAVRVRHRRRAHAARHRSRRRHAPRRPSSRRSWRRWSWRVETETQRAADHRRRADRRRGARRDRDPRRSDRSSPAPRPTAPCPASTTFPADERPPANVVHWSFQTMVGIGLRDDRHRVVVLVATPDGRDPFDSPWFLRAAVVAGGLALVALEAGWITTEVGRQPWIVYGVMRVEDAVTDELGDLDQPRPRSW